MQKGFVLKQNQKSNRPDNAKRIYYPTTEHSLLKMVKGVRSGKGNIVWFFKVSSADEMLIRVAVMTLMLLSGNNKSCEIILLKKYIY